MLIKLTVLREYKTQRGAQEGLSYAIVNTDLIACIAKLDSWQDRDVSGIVLANGHYVKAVHSLDELHKMITPGLWEDAMHAATHLYETWAKHGLNDITTAAMIAFCEAWDRMLE